MRTVGWAVLALLTLLGGYHTMLWLDTSVLGIDFDGISTAVVFLHKGMYILLGVLFAAFLGLSLKGGK